MKTYKIKWEIELDAINPKQAAEEALNCIQYGTAKVFEIFEPKTGIHKTVDLEKKLISSFRANTKQPRR